MSAPALTPSEILRDRTVAIIARMAAVVPRLSAEEGDEACGQLIELSGDLDELVMAVFYPEESSEREETRRAEAERQVAEAQPYRDLLEMMDQRARRLAVLLCNRGPAVIVRMRVEMLLVPLLRMLARCDRYVWRDTYSSGDGSETPYQTPLSHGKEADARLRLIMDALADALAPREMPHGVPRSVRQDGAA